MGALERIAFYQGRRDEVPNQELARALAESRDREGIAEIAANLSNKNPNIQSDCLKVLYEIGYLAPDLIADYVCDFLRLLSHKNNRMVWGGMIAVATVAELRPQEVWARIDDVIATIDRGSVITHLWGVRAVAKVAAADDEYRRTLTPVLLRYLATCIPRDVPTHGESMLCAIDDSNRAQFLAAIEARQGELTPSQMTRLRRVIKQAKGG
jgi:hypothetical protein